MLRAVVLLLVACSGSRGPSVASPTVSGGPAAAPTTEGKLRGGPPLATPGELMVYRLSLRGVELATYAFSVAEVSELAGRRAVVVQGHARTRGIAAFLATIDDRFTSWLDLTNGQPLRFQADEYVSGSKVDIEHTVIDLAARDGDVVQVTHRINEEAPRTVAQKVSQPAVWDHAAFLVALRSWEAAPGARLALEVFRSRYLWHVEVTIHGRERFVSEIGELPALRIEGRTHRLDRKGARDASSDERLFTLWVSDDEGRVPLGIHAMTDYGALKMQIVDYQPGRRP